MKKNIVLRTLMTIIVTAIVTVSVTILCIYGKTNNNTSTENLLGKAMESDSLTTKLQLIKSKINNGYIGEVNETDLMEYAVKGYVAGLNDVYSEYFTADEMKAFTDDTLGNFVGIGVYMTKDFKENTIVVYSTIKNSPAEAAGLKSGDIIVEVNGQSCNGDDFETIADDIKGKEGTKVNLTVLRDNQKLQFEIERKTVEIIRVSSEMLDDKIGYIYLSSFDGNIAEQFENEYESLIDKGAESLIIDVRNNGGGLVDQAIGVGELFTDKEKNLLIQTDKDSKEVVTTSKKDKKIDMNVVLLVNEYSASASEILAGIMKEVVDNATVVGNTTYGKGVIQSLYQLTDGSGLKITTNEYFTPNHNKIHKIGIEPDVKVDNEDFKFNGIVNKEDDKQLLKAMELLKK